MSKYHFLWAKKAFKKLKLSVSLLAMMAITLVSFQNCSKMELSGSKNGQKAQSSNNGNSVGVVQLAWDSNTEANLKGYKIHYGTSPNNYTQVMDVGKPTTTNSAVSYTIFNLVSGMTYYFAVTAYDDSSESDVSNEVSQRIQ